MPKNTRGALLALDRCMSEKTLLLSILASVVVSQGCRQTTDGFPSDAGDTRNASGGVAGAAMVARAGAGGAVSTGQIAGGPSIGGAPNWEGFHCIDGRVRFFSGLPNTYTHCDPALNDGVECVNTGRCPKDALDAGTCEGADTDTDPNHCGACGEVCAPSMLARDPDLSNGLLASDAANVYWASMTPSWVKRMPSTGGDPEVIYRSDSSARATAMAVHSEHVYLAAVDGTFNRGSVLRIPTDGSPSTTLVSGPSAPILELVADANSVYWFDKEGTITKASLLDGLPQVIAVEEDANALAVDENDLYWATYGLMEGQKATIKKVPLDGRGTTLIAELSDRYVEHLAVDANNLYWAAEDGSISRMPKAGGEITVLATPSNALHELTIDGTHAYWTGGDPEVVYGTVSKVPLVGGPVTTLARLQHRPTKIALTASSAVWVQSFFHDKIMSIDKDPCRSGACIE